MLYDDSRNILYQDYSATCLNMIGKMLARESWELPSFMEMAYPEKVKPNDFRTSGEIVRDLLEKLKG